MKKSRLVVDYQIEDKLIGLVAPVKEYKLAWTLNNLFKIKLVKDQDIILEFVDQKKLVISNYKYEREYEIIWLLKNRSVMTESDNLSFLLPELKDFDYFLLFKSEENNINISLISEKLKEHSIAQYVKGIDITTLKSKDNLIFY